LLAVLQYFQLFGYLGLELALPRRFIIYGLFVIGIALDAADLLFYGIYGLP
jgi:hypothetical protein